MNYKSVINTQLKVHISDANLQLQNKKQKHSVVFQPRWTYVLLWSLFLECCPVNVNTISKVEAGNGFSSALILKLATHTRVDLGSLSAGCYLTKYKEYWDL